MATIELSITEYQGMKDKIKKLENALNSVSQEAAKHKEIIEQVKALVIDLDSEPFLSRLFHWKTLTEPLKKLLNNNGDGSKK